MIFFEAKGFQIRIFFVLLSALLIVLNRDAIFTPTNEVGDFCCQLHSDSEGQASAASCWKLLQSRIQPSRPGDPLCPRPGRTRISRWAALGCADRRPNDPGRLYDAFWISFSGGTFMRLTQSSWDLVFSIVMCATLAHANPSAFGWIWFPTLYVLPFTAFVIVLALFVLGKYRSGRFLAQAGFDPDHRRRARRESGNNSQFFPRAARTKIRLALPATDADQDIEVTLHIDHRISPQSVGPSKTPGHSRSRFTGSTRSKARRRSNPFGHHLAEPDAFGDAAILRVIETGIGDLQPFDRRFDRRKHCRETRRADRLGMA